MKKENLSEIQDALFELMHEIIRMKEEQCQGSGYNWQDEIKPLVDKIYPYIN